MNLSKTFKNIGSSEKDKILLAVLPYWTPLLPPQGIARIKRFLGNYGYVVKTVDSNLDSRIKTAYDDYFDAITQFLPEDKQGNIEIIGNDVWREHLMAHINYQDETQYRELIKIIVYQTFFFQINESMVSRLIHLVKEFYALIESYFTNLLETEKPNVVGLTIYNDTLPASLFILRLIRDKYPYIRTAVGGAIFVTHFYDGSPNTPTFLEEIDDYVDIIIRGPGEQLFLKFLEGKLSPTKKIYERNDLTPEELSAPAITIPDLSDFNTSGYMYSAVSGSTSCPYKCSFCNVAASFGDYSKRAPGQIVDDMMTLYQQHNSRLVYMLDALLNPIASELAKELLKTNVSIYWDGYFRVDEDACKIDNAYLWRQGGFYRARLGVESGSQRVLDLMGKDITIEQTKATLSNLAHAGIKTTAYMVVGHPGETEADFQMTLDFVEEYKDTIWEIRGNPFYYYYSGQGKSDQWTDKSKLLYPDWASRMLISRTWILECEPSREEMFRRVNRFVRHCQKLGIPTLNSFQDINRADIRWKKLHIHAVPPVLDLINHEVPLDESKRVNRLLTAQNLQQDVDEFEFLD